MFVTNVVVRILGMRIRTKNSNVWVVSWFNALTVAFTTAINYVFLVCRYDHLARVLTKVLDERPENVVDVFEDISKKVKREKFVSTVDTVRDEFEPTSEFHLAELQKPLFEKSGEGEGEPVCVSNMLLSDRQLFTTFSLSVE